MILSEDRILNWQRFFTSTVKISSGKLVIGTCFLIKKIYVIDCKGVYMDACDSNLMINYKIRNQHKNKYLKTHLKIAIKYLFSRHLIRVAQSEEHEPFI